jgi:hypothetical protein
MKRIRREAEERREGMTDAQIESTGTFPQNENAQLVTSRIQCESGLSFNIDSPALRPSHNASSRVREFSPSPRFSRGVPYR